jgi:Tfp pilus assembly protein FimT
MRLHHRAKNKRRELTQGLTVLELLISLAAIGIVVLIAVPGSDVLLEKQRLKSASSSMMTAIELARTEAGARSSMVIMCPSSNGHTCRNDGDWNHGWLVFSDGNGNGTVEDIELISSFAAPNQEIRINADGAVQQRAAFTLNGLVGNDGALSGQFQICLRKSNALATLVSIDADGWVQKMPTRGLSCNSG